jgi:hypothetical protein
VFKAWTSSSTVTSASVSSVFVIFILFSFPLCLFRILSSSSIQCKYVSKFHSIVRKFSGKLRRWIGAGGGRLRRIARQSKGKGKRDTTFNKNVEVKEQDRCAAPTQFVRHQYRPFYKCLFLRILAQVGTQIGVLHSQRPRRSGGTMTHR